MNFWEGALIGYLLGSSDPEHKSNQNDPEQYDTSGYEMFSGITFVCLIGYLFGGEVIKTLVVVFYSMYVIISVMSFFGWIRKD